NFGAAPEDLIVASQRNLLDAVHVLSYRISAMGLEPELIRSHPELEDHASPFIMQNIELGAFLSDFDKEEVDAKHILVMLDQCREVIAKIRRNISQTGTSIRLTFILQRVTQQIGRLEVLLDLISDLWAGRNADLAFVQLFKDLVYGECHKNDTRQHWQGNIELLALRVTENASRTGEHYITETRSQYFELLRSAMGAGFLITVMAMIKVVLARQHYAPLTEAILFSLNYGIGFVIIHVLHGTVATKQPAMTANSIAISIDGSDGKTREMDNLVTIIAQMMRSQLIAILGNVIIVIPFAMLLCGIFFGLSGHHFVTPQKAWHMLAEVDPLRSGSVIYAGIAGVCLFLSGLIAGYHDNLAMYNKIPQRLRALGWLRKLLGRERTDRMADYIRNNLGALAGNFYFGCLLGGMSGLGVLLGLPIDIRHITFSSAFVGFSLVGLDFAISPAVLWMTALGIALIGLMNLSVSFSLALYVAMKSRKVSFRQWRQLVATLFRRIYARPREFCLPPSKHALESGGEH
ncbi:MAG TPA: site-specific recombinase, partial [Methylophilaceae bacterium]|nr:site-specific recombinase [Methylophilaceae bacterium]